MKMIELIEVTDRKRFFNINQKYLYEMTQFYDDPMDEEGNYHYGYFDLYFEGRPDRKAFYINECGREVGFVMLNRYSHLGDEIDHAMAEFTVYPRYRRHGIARRTAELLFTEYPGRWEIKYNILNGKAAELWNSVAAPYAPVKTRISNVEEVLSFTTPGPECQEA